MTRSYVCSAMFGVVLCGCEVVETSTTAQDLANEQGISMLGFQVDGATLGGEPLRHVRVSRGEVVAEREDASTLRGSALVGAHFDAQVRDITVSPARTELVEF